MTEHAQSDVPPEGEHTPVPSAPPPAAAAPPPSKRAGLLTFFGFLVPGIISTPFLIGPSLEFGRSNELMVLVTIGVLAMASGALVSLVARPELRGLAMTGWLAGVFTSTATLIAIVFNMDFTKGRVLRIEGGSQTRARIVPRRDWRDETHYRFDTLSPTERAALAEVWRMFASMEHASVPAFGKLAERLVAIGAPPSLIERSYQAALDEVRHTKRCLAIASSLAGVPLGPDALHALRDDRARKRRSHEDTITELALSSLEDGALAEGIASRVAARCSELSVEALTATFSEIAHDESLHAALARDVIAYCVQVSDPGLHGALCARLDALRARDPGSAAHALAHMRFMEPYGVLPPEALRAIRDDVLASLRDWLEAMPQIRAA